MVKRTVVLLYVVGACFFLEARLDYATPVSLPVSAVGRRVDTTGWLKIHLTRDGALHCEGHRWTLSALEDHVEALAYGYGLSGDWYWWPRKTDRDVLLCIDARAPYQHVAWLRCMLSRRYNNLHAGVRVDGRKAVLAAPSMSGYWDGVDPMRVDFDDPHILRVGVGDPIPPKVDAGRHLGIIDGHTTTPFDKIVGVMSRFHEAGVVFVDLTWGEAWHPWVGRQARLPRPRVRRAIDPFYETVMGSCSLHLPLAATATPDDEYPVLFAITEHHELVYRGKVMSLNETASVLHRAARAHLFRLRAQGQSVPPDVRPRVLLRGHHTTQWLHVRWFVSLLVERGYRELDVAALAYADLRHSPDTALPPGVERLERVPRAHGCGEAAITFGLHRGSRTVRISVDQSRSDTVEPGLPSVDLVATDRTTLQQVVTVADRARSVGIEHVRFADVPRPSPEVRKRHSLRR